MIHNSRAAFHIPYFTAARGVYSTTGNSTIDTSETRDTQRPWSFLMTCVAMKFVDDDDDDDDDDVCDIVQVTSSP